MSAEKPQKKIGLILSGGGSRAAYQAGALRAISSILGEPTLSPFRIYSGISAGSLNAVYMASRADGFSKATMGLWELWANLRTQDVIKTDPLTFGFISTRLLKDLALGGANREVKSISLVDNKPLRKLIEREGQFDRITELLKKGEHLNGLAIHATNYNTTTSICFYQSSHQDLEDWTRPGRVSIRQDITADHVLASIAIPVFFPPQKIGNSYYGDGSLRVSAPLSAPIHLGADKLMVIGVHHTAAIEQVRSLNKDPMPKITLVDIIGSLMETIFHEGLDSDLMRLNRINRTVDALIQSGQHEHPDRLRHIPCLALKPNRDIKDFAKNILKDLPVVFRYFLKGLGVEIDQGSEFLSYFAFENTFTQRLLDMGYEDTLQKKDEILELLKG